MIRKHFENKALSYMLLWAMLIVGSGFVLVLAHILP